jgi:CxxC motif-containing protein (DUF1111 family)
VINAARLASALTLAMLLLTGIAFAQTPTVAQDPGVQTAQRSGVDCTVNGVACNVGGPVTSVAQNSPAGILAFFTDGLSRFQEIEDVANAPAGNFGNGLGPRFNSNQCSSCHAQPAIGGSGVAVNPQFSFTTNGVAPGNIRPSFITANGPTREARFPFFFVNGAATSTMSGGVEDIFTISGRSDAGTCTSLQQPPFAAALAANDVIFRIPTPTFGDGLIENIDDSTLIENLNNVEAGNSFGIAGTFNHSGNDGTITRFGWKAQNKSLHIFSGEAYNVEMGITNLLFQNERPTPEEDFLGTGLISGCLNNSGMGYPEDTSNPHITAIASNDSIEAQTLDDVSAFANFMRFLAPPAPGGVVLNGVQVPPANIADGETVFVNIGCSICHNASLGPTQPSNITSSLGNFEVAPFSDFAIHHMGSVLADNVQQGFAGGDQFRTAPLWGLGQRIFLTHSGLYTDLIMAIKAHGGEASMSESEFVNLPAGEKQDLLDFLRSL